MSPDEFAAKVKQKYPDYKDIPNEELTRKVISKYPDYASQVEGLKPQTQLTQALKEQPSYFGMKPSTIMSAARPVMEIGGALGGAALAGGASAPSVFGVIPGAMAGGAMGYATGKASADLLERKMGLKKPIASVSEAGKEAAGDLASGVGMEAGGALIGGAAKLAKPVGKGLISVLFGPPLESIEARFANNAAIKGAKPFEVLARELPQDLQKVSDHVGNLSKKALDTLSTSKALMPVGSAASFAGDTASIQMARKNLESELSKVESQYSNYGGKYIEGPASKVQSDYEAHAESLRDKLSLLNDPIVDDGGAVTRDSILKAVNLEIQGLGRTISDASTKAKDVLVRYAQRLSKLGPTVSENQVGSIVRDIDNDIDWSAKDAGPLNTSLEGIRKRLDVALKAGNPEYAESMKPVAAGMRTLKKAETLFRVERDVGRGYKPTNTTATALKSAVNEARIASQDVLGEIHKITGKDYLSASENAKIAESFQGGRAQGSRAVNLGAAIGSGVGALAGGLHGGTGPGMTGAILGAMGGGYMDRQGGAMAGSIIDRLARIGPSPFPAGFIPRFASSASLSALRKLRQEQEAQTQ